MVLCDLCRGIPWESLPEPQADLARNSSGHKYIQPFMNWPNRDRGYPHHQSLSALRQSAVSCPLCQLIRSSAENVEQQLQELKPRWEANQVTHYNWPTYDLFLVKRREGGDGCLVMSFVDGTEEQTKRREAKGIEQAFIIAALGICAREGDPLERVIEGRPVEIDARSQVAFTRNREWLSSCENHATCNLGETLLPTRLIDVGTLDSPKVRLWEPVPEGALGKYVSLSYVWGRDRSFTTTRGTMEERKAGITIADMPATYQDVVRLTRELGLRYLWIDSLCICQDEHEDWDREAAKMLSVYSNAYLTVAAAGAESVSKGFLGARTDRSYVELDYARNELQGKVLAFELPLREELFGNEYITLPNEPLTHRGWALQERLLSRRVMVYTPDQSYFECNEGYRGEDGLRLERRHPCTRWNLGAKVIGPLLSKQQVLRSDERSKRASVQGWYNLLWLYGKRKLTHASDKLPALSGLAKLYAQSIGEEYLAGIWKDQLLEGILWQGLSFRRVSEYRAPSWSWASGDGIPATGKIGKYTEIAEILDAKVILKDTNPFGEVTDGWIKLRAPCEQLYLILDDWNPELKDIYPYQRNVKVRTKNGDPKGDYARFDFDFTADDAPQEAKKLVTSLQGVDIYALFLLKSAPVGIDNEEVYHALIIKKVEGTENYQRLGFLIVKKKVIGNAPEKEDKESFPIITLI